MSFSTTQLLPRSLRWQYFSSFAVASGEIETESFTTGPFVLFVGRVIVWVFW
jgi:hypothetical protein